MEFSDTTWRLARRGGGENVGRMLIGKVEEVSKVGGMGPEPGKRSQANLEMPVNQFYISHSRDENCHKSS